MILVSIHEIRRAVAREHDDFSVVNLTTSRGDVSLYFPIGTAEAVAACINVAVAAGAQAAALKTMGVNPQSVVKEAKL